MNIFNKCFSKKFHFDYKHNLEQKNLYKHGSLTVKFKKNLRKH